MSIAVYKLSLNCLRIRSHWEKDRPSANHLVMSVMRFFSSFKQGLSTSPAWNQTWQTNRHLESNQPPVMARGEHTGPAASWVPHHITGCSSPWGGSSWETATGITIYAGFYQCKTMEARDRDSHHRVDQKYHVERQLLQSYPLILCIPQEVICKPSEFLVDQTLKALG